jgi:hypothetical protein
MKTILLTRGFEAIVDDADFDWLIQWNWHAKFSPQRRRWVAARSDWDGRRTVTVLMHRQILGLKRGEQTDHKNGDTLDNRRSNLRLCDGSENCVNRAHRSGREFRGVFPRYKRFRAVFRFRGKTYRTRTYATAKEAAFAYNKLALKYCPKFAVLNDI